MLIDAEIRHFQKNLELVITSKRLATPFEEAYQWLKERHNRLDPSETICTIACASKGRTKVSHLTWADLNEFHSAYQRLSSIEAQLISLTINSDNSVRADDNELA